MLSHQYPHRDLHRARRRPPVLLPMIGQHSREVPEGASARRAALQVHRHGLVTVYQAQLSAYGVSRVLQELHARRGVPPTHVVLHPLDRPCAERDVPHLDIFHARIGHQSGPSAVGLCEVRAWPGDWIQSSLAKLDTGI